MTTPSLAQQRARADRALAVRDRLVPIVRERGLPFGHEVMRWVAVPYSAMLRPGVLEVWRGSQRVLLVEWSATDWRLRWFGGDGWDAELLERVGGEARIPL